MNILIIGSGGREHALAWAIAKSPRAEKLYCAPGNAGMESVGERVSLEIADHGAIIAFCRENDIGYVVIGPEAPLVEGLADDLEKAGIEAFGPSKAAAQLEGSKAFTKDLCRRHDIPTAAYERFDEEGPAVAYVKAKGAPIVIKADGLAAGKGVTVAMSEAEALEAVEEIFSGRFGAAGASVVIEDYLEGEEASFFVLVDGRSVLPLATAQDHKRVGDGDTGPNTGGMGAYSPAPVMDEAMCRRALQEIVQPTVDALAEAGTPYKGVLYAGLMIDAQGPKLIEYNVRFGDPECQVLMLRLKSDILELMLAATRGTLDKTSAEWHDEVALTVVMAAKGYPGAYEKGSEIKGLDSDDDAVVVFHAGTERRDGAIIATGGRVLNVTARGTSVGEARRRAYERIAKINWPQGFWRGDIGWRAVEREERQ